MSRLSILLLLCFLGFQTVSAQAPVLAEEIVFFNNQLRNKASGQYHDPLADGTNSSIATTGIGLLTLTIGDRDRVITDANIKTVQTLSALLNPKFSKRHSNGWYLQRFNAQDGRDTALSAADGFSTLDTALLVASALVNANYFKAQNKDPEGIIEEFANQLLFSVNWPSAIADQNSERLFLTYGLNSETPEKFTENLNDFILVICLGKLAEARRGLHGPLSDFWQRHFTNPKEFSKKHVDDSSALRNLLALQICAAKN